MLKVLEGLEGGYRHRFTQNNIKEYQTGKRQAMMEYMDSDSRNSPPFRRLAHEKNRCLQGAYVPESMTKGKTTLI